MNRTWREAHPLPRGANLQQRIEWYIAHAAACGCRDMPASVRAAVEQRRDGAVEPDTSPPRER